LDTYGLFEVFSNIPHHLEHKNTEPEQNEDLVIPLALGLSDNSATIKTLLEKEIQLNSLVEDSIISISHFISPKILLFIFKLLKKLIFHLRLKIPPDCFGQLYTTFSLPRILVGVG
jgi:hypothetical protein